MNAVSKNPEDCHTDRLKVQAAANGKALRVASVVFSSYPADPRPRRAAEALAQLGMDVEVICLADGEGQLSSELVDGVKVTRVPLQRSRSGKLTYFWQYGWFIVVAAFILASRTIRRKYDLIHVHNMPDVLIFSAAVPILFGAQVILDLHDPMPELMMTIYGTAENCRSIEMLKWCERVCIRTADAVITVNETCRKIFSRRSGCGSKISVVMNAPDERIFAPRALRDAIETAGTPFVIMYHGSLVERHGLDIAILALLRVRDQLPNVELRIYGKRTPFLDECLQLASTLKLEERVRYFGALDLEGIVEAIRISDVGIIPNRRSIFTELNTPTRIFEYLSQDLPVIAPRAPGIVDYFGEDELFFFELGNAEDLAAKILFVLRNQAEAMAVVGRGKVVYDRHNWTEERNRFVQLVKKLLALSAGKNRIQGDQRPIVVSS
jgi:glycosyltransferase involved in cell wall biosynthesis